MMRVIAHSADYVTETRLTPGQACALIFALSVALWAVIGAVVWICA